MTPPTMVPEREAVKREREAFDMGFKRGRCPCSRCRAVRAFKQRWEAPDD